MNRANAESSVGTGIVRESPALGYPWHLPDNMFSAISTTTGMEESGVGLVG